ncbi:NADPH-dependent F420 reductase [Solirubrobacter soli]|uniref:NADPH-dependent F420 reductase n=1 Tax=Solirubrobacter soli TaxID=363832 RepID=UPI0004178514|nr:NAD(P)-binding domain-containing protein [Solirubrobacter soli]
MTRIGVIGGGNIGRTVGAAWERAGHDVRYSSRSPEPPATLSVADTIAHAEAVLLSTPGDAVPGLLAEYGAALDGRLVIDATNDTGGGRLSHPDAYAHAPGARFVRAFNSLGYELFAEPAIGGAVADLFWCGPEDAEPLLADVGLRPVRVGDIDAIDVVDGVGRLWLTLVFRQGHPRRLAFRMLTEE